MDRLDLHTFHESLGASFHRVNGAAVVEHYADLPSEFNALTSGAGLTDLSGRTRLCLTGADRVRFLHGQVTNDVRRLTVSQGCYATLTTAKGKMQSDLYIHCLADELLLDAEPGLGPMLKERLEKFIVADDVHVVDVSPLYGLLSVQGPKTAEYLHAAGLGDHLPPFPLHSTKLEQPNLGETYIVNNPRLGTAGMDLFIPIGALTAVAARLLYSSGSQRPIPCGWRAFETARIATGIPRFGADMDETSFPQECGIESSAVSYSKGCYIGQEVLNRIHTIGHVTRSLRKLEITNGHACPGHLLFRDDREVGRLTSLATLPGNGQQVALGYLRRESDQPGAEFVVKSSADASPHARARIRE